MNTYKKYCPNVFLAKCETKHEKGDTIILTTKYGKENESIVFNLIFERDGFYYYSIVRADGFNVQEHAKRKAEKLESSSLRAKGKSTEYWEASKEGHNFLSLGEPIKVGHHSEKRHRALIERNHNRMDKSVAASRKAEDYATRAEYWKAKTDTINLSMPESLEYYKFELEGATAHHQGIKSGAIARRHSFDLTYAKKKVNEITKKIEIAEKLWGE